jgi:hypothetical protein
LLHPSKRSFSIILERFSDAGIRISAAVVSISTGWLFLHAVVTILPTRFHASLALVNGITAGSVSSPFNGGGKARYTADKQKTMSGRV